jgi:hypothetical protein
MRHPASRFRIGLHGKKSREGLPNADFINPFLSKEIAMRTIIDYLKSISSVSTRFRGRKASLAGALLLLGGAGLCQAASVVTVTAQDLWNSQVIYTLETNPIPSSGCGDQTVTAPSVIEQTTAAGTVVYGFLFWDVNAQLHSNPTVKFQPVCGEANRAIAVYWPTGGGCAGCPPPTVDSVVAYSLNDAKIITGVTPIVSASSGWTSGSSSVTPPSTIEAAAELPPYGKFKAWDVLRAPDSTASSLSLRAAGEVVVAFYGFPDPDPCQSLRNEIATAGDSCVGDGLSPKACEAYLKYLNGELTACEKTYGELAAPDLMLR